MSPEVSELDQIFDSPMLERDKPWGRPMLVPGEELARAPMVLNPKNRKPRTDGKLPYTRASSLGNYMADHSALDTWRMRATVYGLAQREDLAAMAAALPPILGNVRDKSTLTAAERLRDQSTNTRLDEIAEEAAVYANRAFKANWGTAVHSFTDPDPSGDVPARMAADVESWNKKTKGWIFHATEMFVANDIYQAAGTFDHLVSIPWLPHLGRMVVDKKTGALHPDQWSVQLAVYAKGEPYDISTDGRVDWPDGIQPNQEWGLVVHIPFGLSRTDLYLVDLKDGHQAALTACAVRAHRSNKNLMQPVDFNAELRLQIASLISAATSHEEIVGIYREYDFVWTDDLTALGTARISEVAA